MFSKKRFLLAFMMGLLVSSWAHQVQADVFLNSVRGGAAILIPGKESKYVGNGYGLEVGWYPHLTTNIRQSMMCINYLPFAYLPFFCTDEVGLKTELNLNRENSLGWVVGVNYEIYSSIPLFAGLKYEVSVGGKTQLGQGTGPAFGFSLIYVISNNRQVINKVYLEYSGTFMSSTVDQGAHLGIGFDF